MWIVRVVLRSLIPNAFSPATGCQGPAIRPEHKALILQASVGEKKGRWLQVEFISPRGTSDQQDRSAQVRTLTLQLDPQSRNMKFPSWVYSSYLNTCQWGFHTLAAHKVQLFPPLSACNPGNCSSILNGSRSWMKHMAEKERGNQWLPSTAVWQTQVDRGTSLPDRSPIPAEWQGLLKQTHRPHALECVSFMFLLLFFFNSPSPEMLLMIWVNGQSNMHCRGQCVKGRHWQVAF